MKRLIVGATAVLPTLAWTVYLTLAPTVPVAAQDGFCTGCTYAGQCYSENACVATACSNPPNQVCLSTGKFGDCGTC